jgi:hypothetical protein
MSWSSKIPPDPPPPMIRRDVDAVLDDAGIAGAARDRTGSDPANDSAVDGCDEPKILAVADVPRRPGRRRRLEGRVPGRDALGVDVLDLRPIARSQVPRHDPG